MRKKFVKRSLALALAFTIAFGETGYVLAEEPAQTVEFDTYLTGIPGSREHRLTYPAETVRKYPEKTLISPARMKMFPQAMYRAMYRRPPVS